MFVLLLQWSSFGNSQTVSLVKYNMSTYHLESLSLQLKNMVQRKLSWIIYKFQPFDDNPEISNCLQNYWLLIT